MQSIIYPKSGLKWGVRSCNLPLKTSLLGCDGELITKNQDEFTAEDQANLIQES